MHLGDGRPLRLAHSPRTKGGNEIEFPLEWPFFLTQRDRLSVVLHSLGQSCSVDLRNIRWTVVVDVAPDPDDLVTHRAVEDAQARFVWRSVLRCPGVRLILSRNVLGRDLLHRVVANVEN